ncbi:hypothetical protein O181_092541 [Austropuccinia psidii MF-1]|uniref:Uncharacterized protein n=1 Tax=Austropuccinia psidii MF-1 TaxID=1389203 RepID=A0A9Q3IZP7_9BASI|nr:hypothetical protein [Austropuccinia psidii MF-1]
MPKSNRGKHGKGNYYAEQKTQLVLACFIHNQIPNYQFLNSLLHQQLYGQAPSIITLRPLSTSPQAGTKGNSMPISQATHDGWLAVVGTGDQKDDKIGQHCFPTVSTIESIGSRCS